MTFESLLVEDMGRHDFNTKPYVRSFKARPHISKSKVDMSGGPVYLDVGQWWSQFDYNELKARYVSAVSITYDVFISIYEVNSRSEFAARFVDFTPGLKYEMDGFIRKTRMPNLEARIIGLQNKSGPSPVVHLAEWLSERSVPVYEVDLFGTAVRHIAIDLHTGMSFDVLMENRLYKPGELENTLTLEQFQRGLKKKEF